MRSALEASDHLCPLDGRARGTGSTLFLRDCHRYVFGAAGATASALSLQGCRVQIDMHNICTGYRSET
jgi:hypothetical protein